MQLKTLVCSMEKQPLLLFVKLTRQQLSNIFSTCPKLKGSSFRSEVLVLVPNVLEGSTLSYS